MEKSDIVGYGTSEVETAACQYKRIFKGKERKTLTEQILRTKKEIAKKLDKLPDVLKEDSYPDVQAFMATYCNAETALEQYNRDLATWEWQIREKQKPAKKNRRSRLNVRVWFCSNTSQPFEKN